VTSFAVLAFSFSLTKITLMQSKVMTTKIQFQGRYCITPLQEHPHHNW